MKYVIQGTSPTGTLWYYGYNEDHRNPNVGGVVTHDNLEDAYASLVCDPLEWTAPVNTDTSTVVGIRTEIVNVDDMIEKLINQQQAKEEFEDVKKMYQGMTAHQKREMQIMLNNSGDL